MGTFVLDVNIKSNIFNNLSLTDPQEVTRWHLNKYKTDLLDDKSQQELSRCIISHRRILTMNVPLLRNSTDAGEIQRFRTTS